MIPIPNYELKIEECLTSVQVVIKLKYNQMVVKQYEAVLYENNPYIRQCGGKQNFKKCIQKNYDIKVDKSNSQAYLEFSYCTKQYNSEIPIIITIPQKKINDLTPVAIEIEKLKTQLQMKIADQINDFKREFYQLFEQKLLLNKSSQVVKKFNDNNNEFKTKFTKSIYWEVQQASQMQRMVTLKGYSRGAMFIFLVGSIDEKLIAQIVVSQRFFTIILDKNNLKNIKNENSITENLRQFIMNSDCEFHQEGNLSYVRLQNMNTKKALKIYVSQGPCSTTSKIQHMVYQQRYKIQKKIQKFQIQQSDQIQCIKKQLMDFACKKFQNQERQLKKIGDQINEIKVETNKTIKNTYLLAQQTKQLLKSDMNCLKKQIEQLHNKQIENYQNIKIKNYQKFEETQNKLIKINKQQQSLEIQLKEAIKVIINKGFFTEDNALMPVNFLKQLWKQTCVDIKKTYINDFYVDGPQITYKKEDQFIALMGSHPLQKGIFKITILKSVSTNVGIGLAYNTSQKMPKNNIIWFEPFHKTIHFNDQPKTNDVPKISFQKETWDNFFQNCSFLMSVQNQKITWEVNGKVRGQIQMPKKNSQWFPIVVFCNNGDKIRWQCCN